MVNTQSCLCQDACHMKEALSSVENVADIREMWKGPSLLFATLYPLYPGFTDVKRKKLSSNKFKERGFLTAELADPFILNVLHASSRGE